MPSYEKSPLGKQPMKTTINTQIECSSHQEPKAATDSVIDRNDFDGWAKAVRVQMIDCLRRKSSRSDVRSSSS
jgi:hypothetical protein